MLCANCYRFGKESKLRIFKLYSTTKTFQTGRTKKLTQKSDIWRPNIGIVYDCPRTDCYNHLGLKEHISIDFFTKYKTKYVDVTDILENDDESAMISL